MTTAGVKIAELVMKSSAAGCDLAEVVINYDSIAGATGFDIDCTATALDLYHGAVPKELFAETVMKVHTCRKGCVWLPNAAKLISSTPEFDKFYDLFMGLLRAKADMHQLLISQEFDELAEVFERYEICNAQAA